MISRDRVITILEYLDEFHKASREHALFLLLWDTGARISGLRSLGLGNFDPEQGTVTFRNRPDSGTRLKNGHTSERMNILSEDTVRVVAAYIRYNRKDRTDEYGRKPLLTTKFGRHATSTVRRITYELTQPCMHSECPHNKDRETCEFLEHGHRSKCPSSLSPHPIRTGRITDLRNRGLRVSHVAGRVDAVPDTIRAYYDKPNLGQDLSRRKGPISELGL